ncbi:thiolase domain-containing protein [Haloferax sp. ATB1]|uniref:thiolase domain-containing protein n=1 Tax=Haloferax sp. ATB1 TaxID=1508454 RepID=UPI0005B1FFC7|nr:thiolase domain-containing protein [Haloferax sp. ATB1]
MSIRGAAHIAGAYEHPAREAPDKSTAQLHAEIARGTLADAGIEKDSVDGYMTAGAPGWLQGLTMADYLGLDNLSYVDTTDVGGSSYVSHVGHAAAAIAAGKANVVLITLAGRPRSESGGADPDGSPSPSPGSAFENVFGPSTVGLYALAAQRHMSEYGTTPEQLAEIRVAASQHAQYNDNAMHQDPVAVEDVVSSRLISDPLHLLDCCVISDGGGGLLVVSPEVADDLDRDSPVVLGHGEAPKHRDAGRLDLTYTGAVDSGPRAFEEAGVCPADIDYASIYDSFTITVLETLEDLGFCDKGEGGEFVEGGTLQAPDGELPFNTDGGGLCNNHPGNRGGMTKVIEAVRQLRGEANPGVQVEDCDVALAHGTGGSIASRMESVTLVLGKEGYL